MSQMTGGCACGKVRYTAEIEDADAYLCHCRMCQRASGSISLALKNVRKDQVQWERRPDYFASSAIANRGYCSACGTSLTFEFPNGENMDLTVASFDDPSRFVPKQHFGVESMHRAWLNTEGLPEMTTGDNQPLVDRWIEATGKFPG